MKTFIAVASTLSWFLVCELDAATDEFALSCVDLGSNWVACVLVNQSPKAITYSDYTIGWHEALTVEFFDQARSRWLSLQLRTNALIVRHGGGAGEANVRVVEPLGLVLPPRSPSGQSLTGWSFLLDLNDYEPPAGSSLAPNCSLRVRQQMGTQLGRELPVWKGEVVSTPFKFKPNPRPAGNGAATPLPHPMRGSRAVPEAERWP
jgi:hypothetical protein